MPDIFSKEKRSQIMAKVSSKETKPEIVVRSFLFRHGFRFRKNVGKLPGSPDIVLPKYKTVILVHGCFWHGHSCKKGETRPSTNSEFWNTKIQRNIERDEQVKRDLEMLGWRVLTVWDCELKNKAIFERTMIELVKVFRPNT